MPRGHKSKLRAQEKRRQTRNEIQHLQEAQAPGAQEGERPPCAHGSGDDAAGSFLASIPLMLQGVSPTAPVAGASSHKRSGKGAKGRRPERAASAKATPSPETLVKELHMRKAGLLMHYLLYRYKIKEPMVKGEMLKIIHKRFREKFPEILKMAADRVELLFGLELRELKPGGGFYTLVTKTDGPNHARAFSGVAFPVNGILMLLLGVIFLNGNCATEEEIWDFLTVLEIYDGKEHLIFGEPRQLITKDLVQLEYLIYTQMPNSDPQYHVFLWGPRAYVETSKMKVLEFLAKINETVPSAFPSHYKEALREDEEMAQLKAAASCDPASQLT
ncbi:melanoma-associated antigen B4-like [Cavia porcellus]|uniref:melanoma-associated antigen B4-like n=1 Tax=Cavia porcellus TaxID=10141 RepID=UPI00035139AC|nr:melanoma-associated antigen B4-like [Cavia porcellus]XP_005001436.1 melanoma-associated antigen B4-like [Cavia porcellus]